MGMTSGYHRTDVPIEKVRPLVLWLRNHYGDVASLSEVLGVPISTVGKWLYGTYDYISRPNAKRVLEVFQCHVRPTNPLPSQFELPQPPRLATRREQTKSHAEANWQPTQW